MIYNEKNVAETLFNADAPYIYDGKGNYTFNARSLAIIFNKILLDNEPIEQPQIVKKKPQVVKEQPKPRQIDWGKAAALKKAGWSPKAIAEDIGASIAEVKDYFYIKET